MGPDRDPQLDPAIEARLRAQLTRLIDAIPVPPADRARARAAARCGATS